MSRSHTTDMTTGSPIRHIIRFTLPLLLGNLFQQLYNMVDSVVVGRYVGKDALAAVGSCSSMNFLFFALGSGIGMGIGVIVAQYFGAKEYQNVRKAIASSYYVIISASLVVSITGILLAPWLLKIMDTPEAIYDETLKYLRITCSGLVGVAMYNGLAAIMRSLGDAKTPLMFLIVSSIINVVLDLVFVVVFNLGVVGVALATIIAQYTSAILCQLYAYKKISYFRLAKSEIRPDRLIVSRAFKIGVPLALQNSTIAVSCMALQGVVNGFGEDVIAANTITSRVETLVQQPYGSIGAAVTTFSGQNAGAGNIDRIKKGFRQTTVVVFIFSMCLIPLFYIFGRYITGFFVDDAAVMGIATKALRITSLFYFFLGMIYVPRALLNGCGDTGFSVLNGIVEVVCRVLFSQLLLLIPALGFWIIWMTTAATWFVTSMFCLARYWWGNWKEKALA
ncbi:MAG: MATE family efflux transporter [Ruminococcaceae bacterium]|nr:MATE family efflux transporter [Oscillospiraceae bacterium]